MQWIRIQLSQKKKRKATGQHGKQKDRGRPPEGRGGSRKKLVSRATLKGFMRGMHGHHGHRGRGGVGTIFCGFSGHVIFGRSPSTQETILLSKIDSQSHIIRTEVFKIYDCDDERETAIKKFDRGPRPRCYL